MPTTRFELEFEAELEDLVATLTSGNLEGEAERFAPAASRQGQAVRAQQIIWTQIGQGVRDVNRLTDAAFFDRHPERGGRLLKDNEWALRREWVQIRDQYVRPALFAVTGPSIPAKPPTPKPDPLDLLALSPLPPSENARFLKALDQLWLKVNAIAATDPNAWQYQCWLQKLRQPDVDDRVIRFGAICPGPGTNLPGSAIMGPCYFGEVIGPERVDLLEKNIHTAEDVDRAQRWLWLVTYLKSEIVRAVEWNVALESLRAVHDSVQRAINGLDLWAHNGIGGLATLMPDAYLAILDWIAGRQHDPRSVYSCM